MARDAITTARLHLRRPTDADADDLVALHGDPRVMRFIDDGRSVAEEVVRERDLAWLRAAYGADRGYWVARLREDGRFVGWFGLRPASDAASGLELGYRLTPTAWGHGYATEGARVLVDRAFDVGQATRVWATTMVVNAGSRRVLDKVGLRAVRTFVADWAEPIQGSELGDVEYALEAAGWRRARAAPETRG